MKKLIYLGYIVFSISHSLAQVECDSNELELEKFAKEISAPECIGQNSQFDINDALAKAGNKNTTAAKEKICRPCLEKSLLKLPDTVEISENKKHLADFTLAEAKKSLSQIFSDLMAVRSFPMNFDSSKSVSSCDIRSTISEIKKCLPGNEYSDIISNLEKIPNEMQSEFYNQVQSSNKRYPSLLQQAEFPKNSCGIKDNEILGIKNVIVEEELYSLLSKINYDNNTNDENLIATITTEFQKSSKISMAEIGAHPILKVLFSGKPDSGLKTFMEAAKKSKNLSQFRNQIYSNENAKLLNSEISHSCSNALETMKKTFCSSEFKSGNIFIDDGNSIKLTKNLKIDKIPGNHELKNEALIRFCREDKAKNDKTLKFSAIQNLIDPDGRYYDIPESQFEISYYENRIIKPASMICKIKDDPTSCIEGTMSCSMYKVWAKQNDPKSTSDFNFLASNKEINNILRSLMGAPERSEVKDSDLISTLEREGIIKTTKGEILHNEPKPRSIVSTPTTNIVQTTQQQLTNSDQSFAAPKKTATTESSAPAPASMGNSYSTNNKKSMSRDQTETESETQIQSNIQTELMNRMMKQIVTPKQLEEMVAKAYNKNNRQPLTPAQVTEKTKEFLEETPSTLTGGSYTPGEAKVSNDPESAKKKQQMDFLKAKYGVTPETSGSATGRSIASTKDTEKDKELKEVSVKNTEELKIVVGSLTGTNTEIAKLVEQGSPFILKIGNEAYRISFDKQKNAFITLQNGSTPDAKILGKLKTYFAGLSERIGPSYKLDDLKKGISNSVRVN